MQIQTTGQREESLSARTNKTIVTAPSGLTIIVEDDQITFVRGNVRTEIKLDKTDVRYLAMVLSEENEEV